MLPAQQPMPGRPGGNENQVNFMLDQRLQEKDYFNTNHVDSSVDIPSIEKISAAGNVDLSKFIGSLTPTDELNSMSFPMLDPMQSTEYFDGFGLGIGNEGLMPSIGAGVMNMTAQSMTKVGGVSSVEIAQKQEPITPKKNTSLRCHLITPDPTPVGKRHIDVLGTMNGTSLFNENAFETSLWSLPQEGGGSQSASGIVPNSHASLSPSGPADLLQSSDFDCAVMPEPNSSGASPAPNMDFPVKTSAAQSPDSSVFIKASPAGSSPNNPPELVQEQTFENIVETGPTSAAGGEATDNPLSQDGSAVADVQMQDQSEDEDDSPEQTLDIAACIEPTEITPEQIAAYMQGPDPVTGRYFCTFPKCQKGPLGRKENVKCHIQTHLNDRKYKCPGCAKLFVREHDLKRHWNIHSGKKPFKCPCGKRFHRQDACTRHRGRGTCTGAFPWATPKQKGQRGRPRKNVQDPGERKAKKQQTRKNAKKVKEVEDVKDVQTEISAVAMSASSSSSGTSFSSYQPSQSPVDEGFSNGNMIPIDFLGQGLDSDFLTVGDYFFPPTPHTCSNPGMSPEGEYCFSASVSPVASPTNDIPANVGGNAVLLPSAETSPTMAFATLQPIRLVQDTVQTSSTASGPKKSKDGQPDLTDPVVVLDMYLNLDEEPPVVESTNKLMLETIRCAKELRERFLADRVKLAKQAAENPSSS